MSARDHGLTTVLLEHHAPTQMVVIPVNAMRDSEVTDFRSVIALLQSLFSCIVFY